MDQALEVLKKYYGYAAFRRGQDQIIHSVLHGQDTLGIMPTGGGKSICYQVPALLYAGTTLVVSPLISLMKDQVDALESVGIAATFINSSIPPAEVRQRMQDAAAGKYKLLYIAPERLESESFCGLCASLSIPLLAVDEAHCISHWGHDFRPSYLSIAKLIAALPQRPVVAAFTATATPAVSRDILHQLSLHDPAVVVTGFDRENLSFAVNRSADKRSFILKYLKQNPDQSGIVYASTRKEVEGIYEWLRKRGFAAGKYHAGLSDSERSSAQEGFLYDDIRIMVATNAFGMGIDKSNVRFVLHYNMPKNMESYYQEAGRAGRDGGAAECILLFSPQDIQVQKFLIEQNQAPAERKALEYKKLQAMVDYCHTTRCLRKYILDYFGEKNTPETCSNCSNCQQDGELTDITLTAQKIFSCIRRMRETFGLTLVAEVLKGSASKKIRQYRFNALSTYGILKEYTLQEITELMKILVAEGYIHLSETQYPVAKLNPRALAVLKNEERVFRKVEVTGPTVQVDNGLFEALRSLRKELAAEDRIPPYVVFPDSTLTEMSKLLPVDEQALLKVSGVGEVKLQRYGRRFLEVIRRYAGEQAPSISTAALPAPAGAAAPASRPAAGKGRSAAEKIPSHILTYNLYQQGKSLAAIASARGLSLTTVQDHILRAAFEGNTLDWDSLISPAHEQLILAAIKQLGAAKLKPLKQAVPDEIDYFSIRGVICKHNLGAG